MPSKFVWRRSTRDQVHVNHEPGSFYEDQDVLSRQQRQLETPIYAPGGVFYQVPPIQLPCQDNFERDVISSRVGSVDADTMDVDPMDVDEDIADFPSHTVDETSGSSRAYRKKEEQWHRWTCIIPEMLATYISLLRETRSLRDMSGVRERQRCRGCINHISLNVLCLYFDKIEKIVLCTCKEPALQLLSMGLFPCAPQRPSVAVDVNMLEFARGLFQNLAPNTTAWCETVEKFLYQRGFKLKSRDTLRIRFSNALQWYSTLQDTKHLQLAEVLNHIRKTSDVCLSDSVDVSSHSTGEDKRPNVERPSDYLRQRCLLCFGGNNWHQPDELFDAIVCVDANFTQKRRKSQGNRPPIPLHHPETLFISPDDVCAMQAEVEAARPVKQKPTVDDAYEPGMKVPSATLDECHESFTAADANRAKASTQFFSDTGLMALLCRHDRVLWLVNMTSAGEKQYYVLCLLKKLFEHVPASMRLGALYDIGCQLHRSCLKYGFLADILDRITFAISVFHAYGHQWPCQIIYHPRKCEGFGLSDGEGCERFWSAIKALIPSLRVSGYYTRIYAIDTKVKHLDQTSLIGMGQWLQRKWNITQEKKAKAEAVLELLNQKGVSRTALKQEWNDQVQEQTKPLPRQSKSSADKEIHSILALKDNMKDQGSELATLEDMLITDNFSPGMTVFEVQDQIYKLKNKIKIIARSIEEKKTKLSLADQKNLTRLLGNDFLRIRMNALAVKQRIRERLRHRKYELESFGSSYRNTVNQQKLQQHAEQQIKRKEPGIQNLARTYNRLCQDLEKLITARRAPRGARVPSKISLEGLFKLDVDHDIWQDDNLTNDLDSQLETPGWLGDDDVRTGIKALLQYNRCVEEEKRLIKERQSMQEWFTEEWTLVNLALAFSTDIQDIDLAYQFQDYKAQLVYLHIVWKTATLDLPCPLPQDWGPSAGEIKEAENYEYTEQVISATEEHQVEDRREEPTSTGDEQDTGFEYHAVETDSDSELLEEEEFYSSEEAELVDAMEGLDLAEEF
ncbi:hypothetical protein CVT26_012885, partial [Gymnopilus dilepis]